MFETLEEKLTGVPIVAEFVVGAAAVKSGALAAHIVPFHVLPTIQFADGLTESIKFPLLYRKKPLVPEGVPPNTGLEIGPPEVVLPITNPADKTPASFLLLVT